MCKQHCRPASPQHPKAAPTTTLENHSHAPPPTLCRVRTRDGDVSGTPAAKKSPLREPRSELVSGCAPPAACTRCESSLPQRTVLARAFSSVGADTQACDFAINMAQHVHDVHGLEGRVHVNGEIFDLMMARPHLNRTARRRHRQLTPCCLCHRIDEGFRRKSC